MDEDKRKDRRTRVREVLDDAKSIVKKEFPLYAEETADYRIAVLSIAQMIIEDSKREV